MNLNKLLKRKKCSCKNEHNCEIKHVFVENGAISKLKELTHGFNNILIVLDQNTFNFAGEACKNALQGKNVSWKIFESNKPIIPNEETVESVKLELNKIDLIIGVGSGVIQDVCKFVSYDKKLPYFIIPTAPSMDGYASSTAIMTFNGVKTSISCKPPMAIVADVSLLKNAPFKMIQSGYGDIIGKFSALNDWLLAKLIINEYFCPFIYRLTNKTLKKVAKLTKKLKERDDIAIKTLMEALIVTGICMSFMGNSRSASGSEHLLSHFFETVGMNYNEPYLPHGINVAYSTYHTCKMRQTIINTSLSKPQLIVNRDDYEAQMTRFYGKSAQKLISIQDEFNNEISVRFNAYKTKEDKIKRILKKAPSPTYVKNLLNTIGLNVDEFYEIYSQEKIKNAENYAKNVRVRFTLLHLYNDFINN